MKVTRQVNFYYTGPIFVKGGQTAEKPTCSFPLSALKLEVAIPQFKETFPVELRGIHLGTIFFEAYYTDNFYDILGTKPTYIPEDLQLIKELANENLEEYVFTAILNDEERVTTGAQILEILTPH